MDIELAKHVVRAAFESGRGLESLLGLLKSRCRLDEYTTYSRAVAAAIDAIHREIVDRVIADYPELNSEIEKAIAQRGRF